MLLANPFNGLKYLVVDDFADMRSMVRAILQALGVPAGDVQTARDGDDAMRLLAGGTRFDVVLCDYNLGPGKDGQQVLEEARHLGLLGLHSIFIMITAENTREMVMGAVEYEPDNYLSKPFNKDLLRERLGKLLERKQALRPVNDALTQKNFDLALQQLDALIAQKPKYIGDLLKIKAQIAYSAGHHDDALAIYDQVLLLRELPWAQLGKAKTLFAKKKYPEAQAILEHLVHQNPSLVAAYDWLARIQRLQGQHELAEETLSIAVGLSPKAVLRQHELGDLALHNGHADTAERAFDRAVRLGRHSVYRSPAAYSGLAKSMSAGNKHLEAIKVVQELGKTFAGDNNEAQFYQAAARAVIRQNQGDTAGAAEELQKAENLLGKVPHGATGSLGLELASTCAKLGQNERASELIHSVIANNHDDDGLLGSVGQVLKEAGFEAAPDDLIGRVRKEVFSKNNRGVRLIREGKLDEALGLLNAAADELPSNKTINLNAAKAGIMLMESKGPTPDGIRAVRDKLDRVKKSTQGDDWRIATLLPRLQALVSQTASGG